MYPKGFRCVESDDVVDGEAGRCRCEVRLKDIRRGGIPLVEPSVGHPSDEEGVSGRNRRLFVEIGPGWCPLW